MVARTSVRLVWRYFVQNRMGDMSSKIRMPSPEEALLGREQSMKVSAKHDVNGNRTVPPFPEGLQMVLFGMGCFWGVERKFWRQNGVYSTQVGYSGGYTPNPTYEEVCTGKTGHTEVVRVVYVPEKINFAQLLKVFWESHDPTQGMRQGNDVGTTYRSTIYAYAQEQLDQALHSKDEYQKSNELMCRMWSALTSSITVSLRVKLKRMKPFAGFEWPFRHQGHSRSSRTKG
uniref:peptide-methionine (S)-S-oxide reductase n=1 Tax=Sinocyclocheilus anshuiensis TaxID=1608454 RepID=A0A671PN71_9TELE